MEYHVCRRRSLKNAAAIDSRLNCVSFSVHYGFSRVDTTDTEPSRDTGSATHVSPHGLVLWNLLTVVISRCKR